MNSQCQLKFGHVGIIILAILCLCSILGCSDKDELIPLHSNNFSMLAALETIELTPLDDAVNFMSPLGENENQLKSFDLSLLEFMEISICEIEGVEDCNFLRAFPPRESSVGLNSLKLQNKQYHANWKVTNYEINKNLSVVLSVAGLELRKISYQPHSPQTVPIKLSIENHPRIRARVLHELNYNATLITDSLLMEFSINGAEAAYILFDESFDPEEIGDALRDVFDASPAQAASWMKTGGMDANFVAMAMKISFLISDQEMAVALKVAGFLAFEIYGSLKQVYGLTVDILESIYRAEDILINAGCSSSEALETVRVDLIPLLETLRQSKGPIVYLNSQETYQMSTVHFFMENSTLFKDDVNLGVVTPSELMSVATDNTAKYWFSLNEDSRSGDQANAKSYVHVYRLKEEGYTDFQFWLFYPYNGPGTLSSTIFHISSEDLEEFPGISYKGNLAPMGEHTGDWEAVMVRIRNEDNTVEGVFMSHHGDFPYHEDVMYEGDHPVAYSSLNGHGLYHRSGDNKDKKIDGKGWFDVDLLNICNQGIQFNAYDNSAIVAIDGELLHDSLSWIGFYGQWGPHNDHWPESGWIRETILSTFAPAITALSVVLCGTCTWAACLCVPAYIAITLSRIDTFLTVILPKLTPTSPFSRYFGIDTNGPQSPKNQTSNSQSVWAYDTRPGVAPTPLDPDTIVITNLDTVKAVQNEAYAIVFLIDSDSLVAMNDAGLGLCEVADTLNVDFDSVWSASEIERKEIVQNAVVTERITQSEADGIIEGMDMFDPAAECSEVKNMENAF